MTRTGRGSFLVATLAAALAAVAGAVVWAAITATTHFQIGYMAVGVGFLAGWAMRVVSRRGDRAAGVVAGIIAFLGCVLGNVLSAIVGIAQHEHYPMIAVALAVFTHAGFLGLVLRDGFDLMDLIFYAIAVYAGYRTAIAPRAAQPQPEPEPARTDEPQPTRV